ncbi:26S protease regulatory subunit, putative [Medicago truncatula]|uniref:26S protease regulatory subunit, putative n=1 Tax=Medicago truncatula TaxID=3880 RepID=G7LA61_MEDTR|nr:26S protease regulatory subunit, putative [Medicago truncatula]
MKLGPVFLGPKTGYNNADHIANGFLSAIFRPDTFDPALLWRGTQVFKIHTRIMNCEGISILSFQLGADIRSVCTEDGLYAISAPRKTVTEKYLK